MVIQGNQRTFTQSPSAPSATGSDLYSIASCPSSGNTEAYGGGGVITRSNQRDLIMLESSYPGQFNGTGEVTPFVASSSPSQGLPDNAYEAKALIANLPSGDTFTLQAYVICGPGS